MGKTLAERVRDTVRFNTGGPQPDAIAEHHVRVILVGNGQLTVDEFEAGLEEALDNGWVEWTDRGRLTA